MSFWWVNADLPKLQEDVPAPWGEDAQARNTPTHPFCTRATALRTSLVPSRSYPAFDHAAVQELVLFLVPQTRVLPLAQDVPP